MVDNQKECAHTEGVYAAGWKGDCICIRGVVTIRRWRVILIKRSCLGRSLRFYAPYMVEEGRVSPSRLERKSLMLANAYPRLPIA